MKTQFEGPDRWGSLFIGLGISVYALIGGFDKLLVQILMLLLGLIMMSGGICGT